MPADIFISHASQDREAAEQILAALETRGFSCWIAVRDIPIGTTYSGAILDAIGACRAMVVVVSAGTSASPHVLREVERAVDKNKSLLPVRIEDVRPAGDLEYFLSAVQWVDAFPAILDEHVRRITETLRSTVRSSGPADHRRIDQPDPSSEDRVIADLRMRTLAAGSSRELKGALHEVNAFLRTHPYHADAMMLREELTGAIAAEAGRMQPQPMYSLDQEDGPRSRGRRRRNWMAAALASVAVIAVSASLLNQGAGRSDPAPAGPPPAVSAEARVLAALRERARPDRISSFEFSAIEHQVKRDLLPSVDTAPRVRFRDSSVDYAVTFYATPGYEEVVLITASDSTGNRAYFPDTAAGDGVHSAFIERRDYSTRPLAVGEGVAEPLPRAASQPGYDRAVAALARYAHGLEQR